MSEHIAFKKFLASINLGKYREQYSKIKTVELDLPRPIQALRAIYGEYWDKRKNWADYDDFYKNCYLAPLQAELEAFRKKSFFSEETFYMGLPARIYRTWASLLTQIQAGYIAEQVYGKGDIEMSADLDWQGIDIKIVSKNLNIQIKKESMSREVRSPKPITKKNLSIMLIEYEVPTTGNDRYKKDGTERKPFTDWKKKWQDKLDILDNGFVIFKDKIFHDQNDNLITNKSQDLLGRL